MLTDDGSSVGGDGGGLEVVADGDLAVGDRDRAAHLGDPGVAHGERGLGVGGVDGVGAGGQAGGQRGRGRGAPRVSVVLDVNHW